MSESVLKLLALHFPTLNTCTFYQQTKVMFFTIFAFYTKDFKYIKQIRVLKDLIVNFKNKEKDFSVPFFFDIISTKYFKLFTTNISQNKNSNDAIQFF